MIELSPFYSVILLLAVLAGLPHGAFDLHIAKRLGLCDSPSQVALWLLKYLCFSAAMIAFWLLSPSLALSLFLLIWRKKARMLILLRVSIKFHLKKIKLKNRR